MELATLIVFIVIEIVYFIVMIEGGFDPDTRQHRRLHREAIQRRQRARRRVEEARDRTGPSKTKGMIPRVRSWRERKSTFFHDWDRR